MKSAQGCKNVTTSDLQMQRMSVEGLRQLLSRGSDGRLKLDLSGRGLRGVPEVVSQLTEVKVLDLSANPIETLPQHVCSLQNLKVLELGDCRMLGVIWSVITNLVVLSFSSHYIYLKQVLCILKALRKLELERCRLTEDVITQLTHLENLDLSANDIKNLHQDLSKLTHLKRLEAVACVLSGNIWSVITQLSSLEELNLSMNRVWFLPQELSRLQHLRKLNLFACGLTKLTPIIGQLTSLEEVNLSGNQIGALPKEVSQLQHLKCLRLISCGLTEGIWPVITKLTSLETLSLDQNRIRTLPPDLLRLKHLKRLEVGNCELREIAPEITELALLEMLDLKHNHLKELPLDVINLKNLTQLHLDGNPLQMPPREVYSQGVHAVFNYIREIRVARATHQKVVLLGSTGAGKTSLAKTLINSKPSCVQQEDRTVVLDRSTWDLSTEKNLSVTLIDFGGNDWYKIVHHLFIDKDCLFLLVVNLAEYAEDHFERVIGSWLKMLLSRVSSPHWKLVVTHADQCTQGDISSKCEAIRRDIHCIYARGGWELEEPVNIQVISSKDMSGISKLQQELLSVVQRQGKVIPEAWLELFRKLQSAVHKNKPYLTLQTLRVINEEVRRAPRAEQGSGLIRSMGGWLLETVRGQTTTTMTSNSQSSLESILAFFHAIGAILWFPHTPELSKFIFHNPEYLTSLLKAVFTERLETESLSQAGDVRSDFSTSMFQQAKENLLERGIMSRDLLKCLWRHNQLDEEVSTAMMHLFMHMGFCYAQHRDQDGEVTSFRFPWFLAEKAPDDPDLRQILFGPPTMTRLRITFEYEFLSICPPPMFETFSVRVHHLLGDETSRRDWKDGFQAKIYESHLVVEKLHRGLETVIRFTVTGSDVPQLWKVLTKMKNEMQGVMGEWPGLKFDCRILCPHCVHRREEKPSLFAGKYADKECDPEQLHMSCKRNGKVTEIPACLVYNVEGELCCFVFCFVV